MTPATIRKRFFSVLESAEQNIHLFVNAPGSDMTRHRRCPLLDTIKATLCLTMNRTNTELFDFFMSQNKPVPSKSAFTQQRKKLNEVLFPYILKTFNEKIPFIKTFKGFHIVAADGSDVNLPTDKHDLVYRIKQARSDGIFFQMHLNALYDICENRYITAVTQPHPKMNESLAFCQMVDQCDLPDNTIFIADRGYASLNTMAHLIESGKFFLIRWKSPSFPSAFLKDLLPAETESDTEIVLDVTRSKKNRHLCHGDKMKIVKNKRIFEPIPPDDKKSVYTMKIRCTCIQLETGNYEYLISNLSPETFSAEDLRELYWKRWAVETSFRSLKYALSLVYLHSVNRELIIQEIFAKLIMYNFASLLHAYAAEEKKKTLKKKETKYEYKVSFDDIFPVARRFLIHRMKNDIVKALMLRHQTAVKVNQPPARQVRSQTVKPLNTRA